MPEVMVSQAYIDSLLAKLDRAVLKVEQLQAQAAALTAQLAEMTADRDSEQRWACHYSEQIDGLNKQVAALEAEKAMAQQIECDQHMELQIKIAALTEAATIAHDYIERLVVESVALTDQRDSYKESRQYYLKKVAALTAERDAARKALLDAAALAAMMGDTLHTERKNAECDFSDVAGQRIEDAILQLYAALSAAEKE